MTAVEGISVDLESVQSNIINLDVGGLGIDAATFAKHLDGKQVRGLPGLGNVVRFVTYRGITAKDIEVAIAAVQETVSIRPWTLAAV